MNSNSYQTPVSSSRNRTFFNGSPTYFPPIGSPNYEKSFKPKEKINTPLPYLNSNRSTSIGSPLINHDYLNHRADFLDSYIEDLDQKRTQLYYNLKQETRGKLLDMQFPYRNNEANQVFNDKKDLLMKHLDSMRKSPTAFDHRSRNASEERITPYSESKYFRKRALTPDGRSRGTHAANKTE